ncbi:MAG: cytochrome c peroxidase [Variibacter sp.]
MCLRCGWVDGLAAFAAGIAVALALVLVITPRDLFAAAQGDAAAFAALKATFKRPRAVPFPASNSFSEEKRKLGEMLFFDGRLSSNGQMSCATCHDPARGLADGRVKSVGVAGRTLVRHTPALWNLAWAGPVFWDGRARSLEEQVAGPIQNPDEMNQPIDAVLARLRNDDHYARAFAAAFPDDPNLTHENMAKAIATYERTLVAPLTRFDRWIDGDATALTPQEVAGFKVFTGAAGCSNCHSGFAFTDNAFHDIGLPDDDRGRGAVLRLPAAEHAFKTPSLREAGRTAPYMHDGSLPTFEAVLQHYEHGVVERPTLSADLPRHLSLADADRNALLAFLKTLTSGGDARPPPVVAETSKFDAPAVRTTTVTQDDKAFTPRHVRLTRGERLWVVNNDTRTHNVRVFDESFDFDAGAQEPGETVEVAFPATGAFLVFCGIHPKMELHVDVVP